MQVFIDPVSFVKSRTLPLRAGTFAAGRDDSDYCPQAAPAVSINWVGTRWGIAG